MIEIQHISKKFGDRVIIDDISAQFKPGMCNLIIGSSGSGKTVLVKCIVDLLKADKGEVIFDKTAFSKMGKEETKGIEIVTGLRLKH